MNALSTAMILVTQMMQLGGPVVPHSEADIQEVKTFVLDVALSDLTGVIASPFGSDSRRRPCYLRAD